MHGYLPGRFARDSNGGNTVRCAAITKWLLDFGHKSIAITANLLEIDKPVAFSLAIAQRKQDHAAQITRFEAQYFIDGLRIKAFHRGGIDFLKGCRHQCRSRPI